MPSPNNNTNLLGQTVTAPTSPGEWIGPTWRDRISGILTCLLKPTFTVRVDDGTGLVTNIDADVTMGSTGYSVLLPVVAKAGSTGTPSRVPFQNSGPPSVYTLTSGITFQNYEPPSLYLDYTSKVLYFCTSTGTSSTSVWAPLNQGWNFSQNVVKYSSLITYKRHQVVYVDTANSALGQNQAWPGLWVATQDVPLPTLEKLYPNVQYNPDSDGKITNFDSSNNYWMPVGENRFQFMVSTLSNADYVKAKLWDGTTLSSVEFTIAKPKNLRPSNASETIDGVSVSYSAYTSDNTRTASDGTNTEYQVICPRYVASSSANTAVITASLVLNGSGFAVSSKAIFMQEDKPARVWARRYVQ